MVKARIGLVVVTGTGADCYMGTIVKVEKETVTIKYLDFVVPRIVGKQDVRTVTGRPIK